MRFFADDPFVTFGGLRVVVDPGMIVQFRWPRSKGKRISKKWKKNPANFRPSKHATVDNRRGILYCHPTLAEEMRRLLSQRQTMSMGAVERPELSERTAQIERLRDPRQADRLTRPLDERLGQRWCYGKRP